MNYTKLIRSTAQRNIEVMQQRVKEKKGIPWQMATLGPLGAFFVKLKPQDPQQGPPLPAGLDIKWPELLKRIIK